MVTGDLRERIVIAGVEDLVQPSSEAGFTPRPRDHDLVVDLVEAALVKPASKAGSTERSSEVLE
jgi:hypothetical protein